MKQKIFRFFLMIIVIISIIAYFFGLADSAFRKIYPSRNPISYFINSIKYFVLWVLPYWWIIIIIGAVFFTLLYWAFLKLKFYFQKS